MEYTIKELAELAGVTTRTLRWYDKERLLKPCRTTDAGYRLYAKAEVDRLQHILFYRELGLELGHIRQLLDDPCFDRKGALQSHLSALQARRDRLDSLILTVQNTLKEDDNMSDSKKFEGFKAQALRENEEAYGTEIRQKYGKDTVDESNKMFENLTQAQFDEMNTIAAEIQSRLEAAVTQGFNAASEEGLAIAGLHRRWLGFTWPSYSPEAHAGLGEMYVADQRFTAYYDGRVPGCAAFLRDAIAHYVKVV